MGHTATALAMCACGLAMALAVCGLVASAETSSASKPTPSTSWESVTNLELYRTDFDHINDFLFDYGDGGSIGISNGQLEISSPTEDSYAIVLSRHVATYVLSLRTEVEFPVYTVETVFDSDDSDFEGYFHVLYNGHVRIYATDFNGHNSLGIWSSFYEDPLDPSNHYLELEDLSNPPYEHKIFVEVYGYDPELDYMYCRVYIDDELVVEDFPTEENGYLQDWYKFGDTYSDSDYGGGLWDYLEVRGLSSAKYLEDFNDDNIHDWSDSDATEDAIWRVSGGELFIDTTWSGLIAYEKSGWADTQYIDYNPLDYWTVSLDFQLHPIFMGSTWAYLAYNGQFCVYVRSDCLYYKVNSNEYYVMDLQTDRWYYLEIVRTGASEYTILVDQEEQATGCTFCTANTVLPAIRIGDAFDWEWAKITVDNVRLEVDMDTSIDVDDDLLSDAFETGVFNLQMEEKIIVWYDDFETSLDFEESGWDDSMSRPETDDGLGDDHTWEVGRPTPDYDGNQDNDPEHGWMDVPISPYEPDRGGVLATRIDDDYDVADVEDHVTTPPIDLTNVESARLVFWHWYMFEDGDDGGRLEISIDGGAFALLGTYPTFYSHSSIDALSGPGFSGDSGGWQRAEVSIPPGAIGEVIKLRFLYATDSDDNDYPGWYIDSIRIYGNSDEQDDNVDADFSEEWVQDLLDGEDGEQYLLDGEEYYYFGSSPFLRDTDGDYLYDNVEVFHADLSDEELAGGRADVLTKDIYIEVDYMDGFMPASGDYSTAISSFGDHDIVLHIVMDDELEHTSPISVTTALGYYDAYMSHEREKLFFYCLVADECTSAIYGVTDGGGVSCRFALFHGTIDDDSANFNSILMHELGHDLGQKHYDINVGGWTWKDNDKPDDKAMKTGQCNDPDYMSENSDKEYGYKEDEEDPSWTYDRFGGWEFAYTVVNYDNPQFGLFHGGLWRELE